MNEEEIAAKAAACFDCPLMCNSKNNRIILKKKKNDEELFNCISSRMKIIANAFGFPFVN